MKAKIFSVINQKGGVGKTTTSYNLGALFANDGYKTLLIDSDSQASLTLMLGVDPTSIPDNLCSVYSGYSIRDCIYQSSICGLEYVPSNISLAKTETQLMTVMLGREKKLSKALNEVAGMFDVIIIDCPPTLGLLTINALIASDYVIAPCETTNLSIYAMDDLLDTIAATQESNSRLKFLGVIVTKYVASSKAHEKCLSKVKERFPILGVIKNSVSSQKGIEEGLPCVIADEKSIAAQGYRDSYKKIKGELK